MDGNFVKAADASTNLFGQTLHYGYGVFEGIRSYETVNGVKLFKAYAHYERLKRSCQLMGIPLEYSVEELVQLTYQVLEKNDLSNAYIRPLVFCAISTWHLLPQRSIGNDYGLGMRTTSSAKARPCLYFLFSATQPKGRNHGGKSMWSLCEFDFGYHRSKAQRF